MNEFYEEYRDIPLFNGAYQASNLGNIKRVKGFRKGRNNSLVPIKEHLLKPDNKSGKSRVIIYGKHYMVHILIAMTFLDYDTTKQVHHIDHNPLNNKLENLVLLSVEEHRKLHSTSLITRIKHSIWQLGDKNHMYGRKGANNPSSKRILVYNDNFSKEYDSLTIASEELGIPHSSYLSHIMNKPNLSTYGYKCKSLN